MEPNDFVKAYESALATQSGSRIAPLMHDDVCVTFSSGSLHRGLNAAKQAFEANLAAISCERFEVSNIH